MKKLLALAGVPEHLWPDALDSLALAKTRAKGLTLAKWKVRLFKAGAISKMLKWQDERLLDVRPELADWDIAPAVNITAHGDNAPWVATPDGYRPAPGRWLNADPTSAEHKEAVAANYWCKGKHPRSHASRKAWYRRNAGEYAAWDMGHPLHVPADVEKWQGADDKTSVTVYRSNGAWLILSTERVFWKLHFESRKGFEIDNVLSNGTQMWYPLPGYELRAPVTWSLIPRIKKRGES